MARGKEFWKIVEGEWVAGQLDRAEISRRYKVDRKTVRSHMKKYGLEYGSGRNLVNAKIQAKLIANSKAPSKAPSRGFAESIENAADIGVAVIELHRNDIQQLREKEELLLEELFDNPTKLWIGQYQGEIVEKEVGIAVTDRITAFTNLTNARKTRIGLERQAFNLDAENTDSGNSVADAIREAESCRRK